MIELIEKIEGEAKLDFSFNNGKIDFVDIEFLSSRHIENILKGKNPLDALVINPRVCGICGHAHLIATVKALEDCYDNIEISNKAKIIRELTLNFELIQNHIKWFYLVIYPFIGKRQDIYKATYPSSLISKAIALISGQYPHNSYAIPGGVVGELVLSDLIKIENILDEVIGFYQKNIVKVDITDFVVCDNIDNLYKKEGDLITCLEFLKNNDYQKIGRSYDRFLVFGENSCFDSGKSIKTRMDQNIDIRFVKEYINEKSYAKNVKYKDKFYEVGPLSRAMVNKYPLIKDAHRRYKDSILSRILARVCEIPRLLLHSKELIKNIDLSEPSYIKPKKNLSALDATGVGIVEAARGSLIHKIQIKDNKILDYQIITPTQWNLSNGTKNNLAIAQKSMVGLRDKELAKFVFKSFDVCSVCTTH